MSINTIYIPGKFPHRNIKSLICWVFIRPMDDVVYLRQGDDLIEMIESEYEYERVLQERLATHPRLLAGGKYRRRELIVGR